MITHFRIYIHFCLLCCDFRLSSKRPLSARRRRINFIWMPSFWLCLMFATFDTPCVIHKICNIKLLLMFPRILRWVNEQKSRQNMDYEILWGTILYRAIVKTFMYSWHPFLSRRVNKYQSKAPLLWFVFTNKFKNTAMQKFRYIVAFNIVRGGIPFTFLFRRNDDISPMTRFIMTRYYMNPRIKY